MLAEPSVCVLCPAVKINSTRISTPRCLPSHNRITRPKSFHNNNMPSRENRDKLGSRICLLQYFKAGHVTRRDLMRSLRRVQDAVYIISYYSAASIKIHLSLSRQHFLPYGVKLPQRRAHARNGVVSRKHCVCA
jgi:hypothetical protein